MFITHYVKQVDADLIVTEEPAVIAHTSVCSKGGYAVHFLITNITVTGPSVSGKP